MTSVADIIRPPVAGQVPDNSVFVGAIPPAAPKNGDVWFDTNANGWKRWNNAWTAVATGAGGAWPVGPTAPANPAVNDLWFDTHSNMWKRWAGTAWLDIGPIDAGNF